MHRTQLGLTQAQIAERLGYTANTIARWERGELKIPDAAFATVQEWAVGSRARLPMPKVPTLDSFHADIVARLDGYLDPAVFETCALALLRPEWPGLVPIVGGSDDGFDGAVSEPGKPAPFPLIVTTDKSPGRNLTGSIQQAISKGHRPTHAILATSRRLTQKTRKSLTEAAAKLGVQLRQIYDGAWFASALYGSSEWCRRLLGLSGSPEALSKLHPSPRPLITSDMLGRAPELVQVKNAPHDVLVVGGPGSGKTMLMRQLVDDGYFLWSHDPTATANAIRQLSPSLVVVDDAHSNTGQLEMLVAVRKSVGAPFRIVAAAWEPYADVVRRLLVNATVVPLLELDADIIADIVRSVGLVGPNVLIADIVRQAVGRPGLAAALASLCLQGEHESVLRGEAMLEQFRAYAEDDVVLLGHFALTGDVGAPVAAVAGWLKRPVDQVQQRLDHLAAGGVLRIDSSKRVSVWPERLRYVLVRETFFGRTSGLSHVALLEQVPSRLAAVSSLVGAAYCGATVSGLREEVVRASDERLWVQFAWLDSESALYVLEEHADLLLVAAAPLLHHVPDRAIEKLLDMAVTHGVSTTAAGPMNSLKRWLRGSSKDESELVQRSQLVLDAVLRWHGLNSHSVVAVAAFCLAMSPNVEFTESDPGQGRSFTWTHGVISGDGLRTLFELWERGARELLSQDDVPWETVLELLREWRFPNLMVPLDETTEQLMSEITRGMVLTLVSLQIPKHGVQRRLRQLAEELSISVESDGHLSPEFEVLFPRWRSGQGDPLEAHRLSSERARAWARERVATSSPSELLRVIVSQREQALVSDLNSDGIGEVFAEIASCTTDRIEWLRQLVGAGIEPQYVWPFMRRLVDSGTSPRTILAELGGDPRYEVLLAEAIVASSRACDESIAWVLTNASSYAGAIASQCRVGDAQTSLLRSLLAHSDPKVRIKVAVATYVRRERRLGDELGDLWRAAIVASARSDVSGEREYWFERMLTEDTSLGFQWLEAYLTRDGPTHYSAQALAVLVASKLDATLRHSLVTRMPFTAYDAEILKELVRGDVALFAMVLARTNLGRVRLAALAPRYGRDFGHSPSIRSNWTDLAVLALDAGFKEADVLDAIEPTRWGSCGSAVPMWTEWRDGFQAGTGHPNPAVRRIAAQGVKHMDYRIAREVERDRLEAVRGIH